MSFHIPGPTKGKVDHLIATYGAERLSKPPKAFHDIPESKALLCVVAPNIATLGALRMTG